MQLKKENAIKGKECNKNKGMQLKEDNAVKGREFT